MRQEFYNTICDKVKFLEKLGYFINNKKYNKKTRKS